MFKTNLTQLLMVFVMMFSITITNAQVVFSEDFNATTGAALPAGFTTSGAATTPWGTGTTANATSGYVSVDPSNTTRFAFINDDACNCTMNDDKMILPVQDFSTLTGVSINFDYFSQQYYGSEWAVEVSTNGGTSWTQVYVNGSNAGWASESVNLSAYAGMSAVSIAFRYDDKAQWAGAACIDNISIEVTPAFDLALGLPNEDAFGWTREYLNIIGYQYQPISQLSASELLMGTTISNRGLNDATNTYVRVNVDMMTAPNTYANVFTDTIQAGTVQSDSVAYVIKEITDTTWCDPGYYRLQYIVYQDSVDQKPNSDTITDFFTLTENMWSKVDLASDGGPYGDNAYLPGGLTGGDFISLMDWGTVYYFPNGAGYILDTCTVRFFSSTSAAATEGVYNIRISKIVDDGNGTFDITLDKQLSALAIDTVAITPGASIVRKVQGFLDVTTFAEFQFEDDELYFISVYQNITATPGLTDGTVRNGLYPYGQTINHDGFVYANNSAGFPFYNPLIIETTAAGGGTTTDAYEYGWTGGPEPSIVLNLKATNVNTQKVEKVELAGVEVFPNPTNGSFTVNVSLDNAETVKYILTDVTGRVVNLQFGNNVGNDTKTYDISAFPSGVYFLTVIADGNKTTKRIIKK